jgi:lipopolysaccharide export system protein LptC
VARLLEQHGRQGAAAAVPAPGPVGKTWRPRVISDAYSRRVALLKRILPAVGFGLLLLVGAWPRLEPLLYSVRFGLPVIDRRDARELQMVHPRYAGVDRLNRPYVLTAAAGRKMPDRNDLMSLDRPRGQLLAHGGATVVLTAAAGVYQTQSRLLDLFGDVTLTHQDGTRFVTQAAHIDFSAETASGHDPVAGDGPSGSITAQGFRIADKGDTIFFTGRSHLLLKRVSASRPSPPPPRLPPRIEAAAASIAAAASMTDARPRQTASGTNPKVGGQSATPEPPGATPSARPAQDATASEIRRHGG